MAFDASLKIVNYGNPTKAADFGNAEALAGVCIAVASQAKALSPVRFGQLRNSIMWNTQDKTGGLNDSPGKAESNSIAKPPKNEGYVGSASDHAIPIEFGTRYMQAQPFLRPAGEIVTRKGEAAKIVAKYQIESMDDEFPRRNQRL